MTDQEQEYYQKDFRRAARLLELFKGEIADMNIHARLSLVQEMFRYLKPELQELVRRGIIK